MPKRTEKNEIKSRADAKFSVSKKFKKIKINIKYTLHMFSHLVICVFSRYRFFHVGKKIKMKISTCKVKINRPDSLKSTQYLHYTCVLCQKSV